ncbi:HP0495 family protein [Spongorhabdus nitratireducens]
MSDKQQAPEAPRIEFPCDYPIRVMGDAAPDFKDFVCRVMKKHDPEFNGEAKVRDSRTGKYLSVLVTIKATGEPQLKAIFEELKASGRIKMVL